MSALEALTDEQKQKAFERARDESPKIPEGRLVRITEEYYRAALDFARDYFVPDEPVTGNAGVNWGPVVEECWLAVLRQGLSLMLLGNDGDVIAFRCTRMHKLEEDPYKLDSIGDPGTRRIWAYVGYCDERAKVLEHFGVTESLHLVGLAVNNKYRRKGLAAYIMQAALLMYEYLGIDPLCVKGEASSNYSKKVYAKTGFKHFYEKPYVDYIVDGVQVFQNTGVHTSMASLGQLLRARKVEDGEQQGECSGHCLQTPTDVTDIL